MTDGARGGGYVNYRTRRHLGECTSAKAIWITHHDKRRTLDLRGVRRSGVLRSRSRGTSNDAPEGRL